MDAEFASLQAWFQHQLLCDTPGPDWPVEAVIDSSRQRTPAERLAVYQNAYVARLVDCLAAEFPAVQHAVGADIFLQFAAAHVARRPSQSYTLGQLGADFAETLRGLRPPRSDSAPDFADFLIDLARYERVVTEVFDAEGPERSPPFDVTVLETAAESEIEQLRFEFFRCVRPLVTAFPVHEYASSVRHGQPCELPAARPVRLVMHRRDYIVRRWEAAAWEFSLLEALLDGAPLATAMDCVLKAPDVPENFAGAVFETFQRWARAELFRGISQT